ncbi:hypothetical protein RV18_GL002079 [Enterococcus termitis]|nr:hypothetical protein RV18_GL002079 [Enterococcus termitis]
MIDDLASQNNLRALFDWIQIQLFINDSLDTIIHNVLGIPSDYFFLKQGKLEHYDYDHVVEYGSIRIYFDSSGQKLDCMLVMSGEALEFYRTEVLGQMKLTVKDFLLNLFQIYENQFKITRVDPAIDDWNTIPYFTPQQLMRICRKNDLFMEKAPILMYMGLKQRKKG